MNYDEIRKNIADRFEKVSKKIPKNDIEIRKIIRALNEYRVASYQEREIKFDMLVNILWDEDTNSIEKVFVGNKNKALQLLIGEEKAEEFKMIWNRSINFIYSSNVYRRSYKSKKNSKLYLRKNIQKLYAYIRLTFSGFTLDKFFENSKNYINNRVVADIIAIEFNKNNEKVMNQFKEIVYSENNVSLITRELIKAALMSENENAHKMIGDLLLAAKLQEGLRQSIVECLDEGSKKVFLYILKLIIDNNLIRFSSVVRAFDTWTGIVLDIKKPKLVKECFETAYQCLKDEKYKNMCLDSDNNLSIYIALWSIAFDEVEDGVEVLRTILRGKIKYKKQIALEFLYQTQDNILRHKLSCETLDDENLDVIAFAIKNLFSILNSSSIKFNKRNFNDYISLSDDYYGEKLFYKIKNIIDRMPKKKIIYSGVVFGLDKLEFSVSELAEKLLLSVAMKPDEKTTEILIDYIKKMDADTRYYFIEFFLKEPKNQKERNALLEACGDKSSDNRKIAFKIISNLKLTSEDYLYLENLLKYKYGDLRKNVIKLLLKQNSKELLNTVKNLSESKVENKKIAAIEIVNEIENEVKYKEIFSECIKYVSIADETLQNTKLTIKIKNNSENKKETKNFENGFGLYDPSKEYIPSEVKIDRDIEYAFSIKYDEIIELLKKFSNFIDKYKDFEYEIIDWAGNKEKITLGGSNYLQPINGTLREKKLDNYPLANEIREFAKENKLTDWKLLQIHFIINEPSATNNTQWYESFLKKNFNYKALRDLDVYTKKIKYYKYLDRYIDLLSLEIPDSKIFEMSKSMAQSLYSNIPKEKFTENYTHKGEKKLTIPHGSIYQQKEEEYNLTFSRHLIYWQENLLRSAESDEQFTEAFSIIYKYYKSGNYKKNYSIKHFARAFEIGIINENEIFKQIMTRTNSPKNLSILTNERTYKFSQIKSYKKIHEVTKKAVKVITEIESKRGELETEVTHLAAEIHKCYGINTFVSIIINFEKDTYVRGYNYVHGDCTKKAMLSHLLKCCYPEKNETSQTLKEALKGKKVTPKQLIEAAMYSPQWLDIVSDYLDYKGLKSICWYFHAHVNDYFSDEKTAIIARYTSIPAEDLRDGAFDQDWFKEAYEIIGDKKFKEVYNSAKYIAGGGLHKRSQLFADATLGKLDIKEIKIRVKEKRTKDYLLTYGLIPIKNKKDLLERYEYIQQFVKESKKFGTQRRASEKRCANLTLSNLARNAGFSDVNRLIWNMESEKIKENLIYLKPKLIEDTEVKLVIDELGTTDISCIKNGKQLKNIPAKLRKNEYILKLKELKKSFKDQYTRAKKSFEDAMENSEIFKGEELIKLFKNPILNPLMKSLLFKTEKFIGYLSEDHLINYENNIYKIKNESDLIIVHPLHLYEAKVWHEYQRDIFAKKIVQPFKQVFRELYLPNPDELKEQTLSRRYAGYQVQPKKTVALLKTRDWISSYEEGLQKVYYKDNIVATIYAQADWFSPADIESPVLEYITFEDRKTYKPIKLNEVPKLIFSEIMRDMDLVVSVAHVGGVDPEASLSTMEVRTVIVEEILKLMKIKNVELKGSHAFIKGNYGEYTVHLGSGIVHKTGSGSINIISVQSGHRGKIFLPFIDSDPRSVEIITKITLLANDKKIKDPNILEQITK